MRWARPEEIRARIAADRAWAWVHSTCEAVVTYATGETDPELVLEAFDEVSAQIEAKGMTATSLIEVTIGWAHNRIERGRQ